MYIYMYIYIYIYIYFIYFFFFLNMQYNIMHRTNKYIQKYLPV